jgi:hypothetical protein
VIRVMWFLSVIRVIRLLVMQLRVIMVWFLVFASGRFWSLGLLVVACGCLWLLVVLRVIHLPGS